MRSVCLCLPIHPTEVLDLDEDDCSDLVNQFGGRLIRLISLYVEQSSSVLEGAKKGGHIRWHILAEDQTQLSSNYRDGCLKTYSIKFWLDESVQGVVPSVLDKSELRKFGRDLGVGLDEIRKLRLDQVVWVCQWLQDAGMIECFEVQENQATAEVNPLEPLGLCPPCCVCPRPAMAQCLSLSLRGHPQPNCYIVPGQEFFLDQEDRGVNFCK